MKGSQKGQEIVEFAVVMAVFFPIILVLVLGIMYCGFMYGDYMTLNDIVRNAARTAAVSSPSGMDKKAYVAQVQQNFNRTYFQPDSKSFTTHLYTVPTDGLHIVGPDNDGMIHAYVTVKKNGDFQILSILENLGVKPVEEYPIDYYMYDEDHTGGTT